MMERIHNHDWRMSVQQPLMGQAFDESEDRFSLEDDQRLLSRFLMIQVPSRMELLQYLNPSSRTAMLRFTDDQKSFDLISLYQVRIIFPNNPQISEYYVCQRENTRYDDDSLFRSITASIGTISTRKPLPIDNTSFEIDQLPVISLEDVVRPGRVEELFMTGESADTLARLILTLLKDGLLPLNNKAEPVVGNIQLNTKLSSVHLK